MDAVAVGAGMTGYHPSPAAATATEPAVTAAANAPGPCGSAAGLAGYLA